jgi:DNA replication protein DnaC
MDCKLSRTCKRYGTEHCSIYCYSYVLIHGIDGKGGFWATRNVPKKCSNYLKETLPISAENPQVYKAVMTYVADVLNKVQKSNRGIYFCGGTGTGKTTVAITILNEYLIARVIQHLKGELKIEVNPVLFIKLAEFQNIYNSQFRGTSDLQNVNSDKYYKFKQRMKEVDLLVVDDIALRGCPEGFQNELYEIIDCRSTEDATTLFTSNVTYEELPEYVGDRIASRISGMCGKQVILKGHDHREGGLF